MAADVCSFGRACGAERARLDRAERVADRAFHSRALPVSSNPTQAWVELDIPAALASFRLTARPHRLSFSQRSVLSSIDRHRSLAALARLKRSANLLARLS